MREAARAVALLATVWVACNQAREILADESVGESCTWDELNHSTLVECNDCPVENGESDDIAWPDFGQVLHLQSTRAGQRFATNALPRLESLFDEHAKLFDINTTLRVSTYSPKQEIIGLGATLDLALFASAAGARLYRPILADLFGSPEASARMTFLRLRVDSDFGNLTDWLLNLETEIDRVRHSAPRIQLEPIKVIIHPLPGSTGIIGLADVLPRRSNLSPNLELWGYAFNSEDLDATLSPLRNARNALPEGCRLLASAPLHEAPSLLETIERFGIDLQGLLVSSEASVPYEVLEHLVARKRQNFQLIAVARPRPQTEMYGDWSNAHEYAVEILNHLKHGATGFLEQLTVADLPAKSTQASADCSLYSLLETHKTHFRGPMYYAVGHFSRFLSRTRQLSYELFTQPNMFSAHFTAFLSSDSNYIIALVLNGNEHHLPFSLNIDNWIAANTLLEPKSFNTFILKV